MKKKILISIAALMLLGGVLLSGTAEAFWLGTANYSGIGGFSAMVDWWVYKPAEVGGQSGVDFTYYYLITNTSAFAPQFANWINYFNVGNPSGAPITGVGTLPMGGIPPWAWAPQPGGTTALFFWPSIPDSSVPPLLPAFSEKLFFTSPYAPIPVNGGLLAIGGATDTQLVRGPGVPEPATMSLLGLGILGLLGLRKRRA